MLNKTFNPKFIYIASSLLLFINTAYAANQTDASPSLKDKVNNIIRPQAEQHYKMLDLKQLSTFKFTPTDHSTIAASATQLDDIDFFNTILRVLQRNPQVGHNLALVAAQNSNIDVAKSQYFPQLSSGITTGNLDNRDRNRQVLSVTASQLLYDFGKVKTSVEAEKQRLKREQANVLIGIDDLAYQTSLSLINIERYRINLQIAEQQVHGIKKILEIAQLRAHAGISSQADPVQAESYLQSAQSNLIMQQSMLRQYQQRLNILLGSDVSAKRWLIPERLVTASELYTDPEFNQVPKMIAAHIEVEMAKMDRKQILLSRYPTLLLKGSASQAINGVNPNNNQDNGFDTAFMIEARSDFYQGGATAARTRTASYAEQAAKSKVNAVYLDVIDQIRSTRETIENKQKQMVVLLSRQSTTLRTRELYQEQYKLGTRSVLDLLNAEMAIHTANNELENARYDIYSSLAQFIAITGRTRQVYDLNNISIQGFEVQP